MNRLSAMKTWPWHILAPVVLFVLIAVLAPWITGRYTLYAAFPSRKFMPMRTRAFLEFLTTRTRADIENANLAASPAP